MIVTRLKLANLRAIETAEFRFRPGLNLIVGVNGVGKTTVLDALAVCLSGVTKQANKLQGPGPILRTRRHPGRSRGADRAMRRPAW